MLLAMGLPLWSVGKNAKGFFALGFRSEGIFSLGFFSKGIFSLGCFTLGGISVGMASLGLLFLGAFSRGHYFAYGDDTKALVALASKKRKEHGQSYFPFRLPRLKLFSLS